MKKKRKTYFLEKPEVILTKVDNLKPNLTLKKQ